jgi:hypothetical protein
MLRSFLAREPFVSAERGRPPADRLGLHRLAAILVIIQAGMLAFDVIGFHATGLTYEWKTRAIDIGIPAALMLAWAYFFTWPGRRPGDWVVAEMWLVLALFISISAIAPVGQYAAVAFKRPLIDPWLAAFDAAIGAHVPTWAAWVSGQPLLLKVLLYAYLSLLAQFFLPILLLGVWYRNRIAMWEYAFHFHVCSAIVLVCLALWPVAIPGPYYGFKMAFNLSRFIAQFSGVYSGAITTIRPEDMEGLVSFPSFHVAGAVMVTWALRQSRVWMAILLPINLVLTVATVLTGVHYVADLFGTAAMCAISLWLYRRFAVRWLEPGNTPVHSRETAPPDYRVGADGVSQLEGTP